MKRANGLLIMLVTLLTGACDSCGPKEICFDHVHIYDAIVAFGWEQAPEAAPLAMETVFFPVESETSEVSRFMFVGHDGGTVRLPYGEYCVVGFNGDLTYGANVRRLGNIETIEMLTDDEATLPVLGLNVNAIPRLDEVKGERMAKSPEMSWVDRLDGFVHVKMNSPQKITLRPRPAVAEYSLTVIDIEGFENLRIGALDATLSGLAEGLLLGSQKPSAIPITIPFGLKADKGHPMKAPSLNGRLLTFGAAANATSPHILSIYMVGADGTASWQTFDVTEQIRNAPDPYKVNIMVSGLKIPNPTISDEELDSSGRFNASVTGWSDINETIIM